MFKQIAEVLPHCVIAQGALVSALGNRLTLVFVRKIITHVLNQLFWVLKDDKLVANVVSLLGAFHLGYDLKPSTTIDLNIRKFNGVKRFLDSRVFHVARSDDAICHTLHDVSFEDAIEQCYQQFDPRAISLANGIYDLTICLEINPITRDTTNANLIVLSV